MPDAADAFLDAAVRSFDDNAELQEIARRKLAVLYRKPAPPQSEEAEKRMRSRSGNLAYHVFDGIGWESAPEEPDLRPGRLADRERMNRPALSGSGSPCCCWASWS